MSADDSGMTDDRGAGDVAQLIEAFRDRPFFVSTIRASITHRIALLMFHEGDVPFPGIAVAICGMSTFEGDLLRSGPHRFEFSETLDQDTGVEQWVLNSEDNSFRVAAKEIRVRRDKEKAEQGKFLAGEERWGTHNHL